MTDSSISGHQALTRSIERFVHLTAHVQAGVALAWALCEVAEYFMAEGDEQLLEGIDLIIVGLGALDKAGKLFMVLPSGPLPTNESGEALLSTIARLVFELARGEWRKAYKPLKKEADYALLLKEAIAQLLFARPDLFIRKYQVDDLKQQVPFLSDQHGRLKQVF